jgi:chromosome partition protein MukE
MSMETPQTFDDIAQVVEHELFPDVDLALRRGRHIDRDDAAWYGFLSDAQALLEKFYRRYGAELVQRTDGFFFLLPSGDKLGRRHLSPSEMLVGQGLTLLYLEPATLEQGGISSRDQLLSQLSASMGTEQLMLAFNAKKKKLDERVAQEMVRARVSEAIRRLASLGFVELLPEDRLRLRSSLMRFAEPVRGSGADVEALARLVASGEVALTENDDDSPEQDDAEPGEAVARAPARRPEPAPLPEWNEGSEWGASFDAPAPPAEDEPEPDDEARADEPEPNDEALADEPEGDDEAGSAGEPELADEADDEPETESQAEVALLPVDAFGDFEPDTETELEPLTESRPERVPATTPEQPQPEAGSPPLESDADEELPS